MFDTIFNFSNVKQFKINSIQSYTSIPNVFFFLKKKRIISLELYTNYEYRNPKGN